MTLPLSSSSWQEKRRNSRALTIDEPDYMVIWLDLDQHIQFISEVLARADLLPATARDMQSRLDQVQQRRTDPHLYVAVVGEFNSGKSTFINALLRQELLKQSTVVRTAVPTKIYYAPDPDLTVFFEGRAKPLSYSRERKQLRQLLLSINPKADLPSEDLREYLHLITTDVQIAPKVRQVLVQHPASFLAQNIVIIDTPGTNARDPQHARITRHIIEHDADVAVITIPATIALANTLVEFMQQDLHPFLHRCVAVVTRLDELDEEDQQIVLTDIRRRLPELTNTPEHLPLYEAAPQVVLQALRSQASVPADLQQWNTKFADLEAMLWNRLCKERTLSSTETLLRLLNRLLSDLEAHLQEHLAAYAHRQQAIAEEIIPDLTEFATEELNSFIERLKEEAKDAAEDALQAFRNIHEEAVREIVEKLNSASSDDDFKALCEIEVSYLLTQARDSFIEEFKDTMHHLQKKMNTAAQRSEERFAEAYQRLEAVGEIELTQRSQLDEEHLQVASHDLFAHATQVTTEINSQEGALIGGGMMGGAVLGTVLIPIPVLGTILGGLIGGFLGALFVSTERKRARVAEALAPEIDKFFEALASAIDETFEAYGTNILEQFVQNLEEHVNTYEEAVNLIQEQQERESQELQQTQETVHAYLQELQQRGAALEQKQQMLRSTALR